MNWRHAERRRIDNCVFTVNKWKERREKRVYAKLLLCRCRCCVLYFVQSFSYDFIATRHHVRNVRVWAFYLRSIFSFFFSLVSHSYDAPWLSSYACNIAHKILYRFAFKEEEWTGISSWRAACHATSTHITHAHRHRTWCMYKYIGYVVVQQKRDLTFIWCTQIQHEKLTIYFTNFNQNKLNEIEIKLSGFSVEPWRCSQHNSSSGAMKLECVCACVCFWFTWHFHLILLPCCASSLSLCFGFRVSFGVLFTINFSLSHIVCVLRMPSIITTTVCRRMYVSHLFIGTMYK